MKLLSSFLFLVFCLILFSDLVSAQKIISFTTNKSTYFPGELAYFKAMVENEDFANYKSEFVIMKTSAWEYSSLPEDTIVYRTESPLNLQPNEIKSIDFLWKIPETAEPGIYRAYFRIRTQSGVSKGSLTELFEVKNVNQEVKAVRLWGLEFVYNNETGSALEGFNVDPNSEMLVQFMINNTGNTALNLKIVLNFTYTFHSDKSAFSKESYITLYPSETKKIVFRITSPNKPTSYSPTVKVWSENKMLGELIGRLVVKGYSGSILDAYTDKIKYLKGEPVYITAKVTGSADYKSELGEVDLYCKILDSKEKEIISAKKTFYLSFDPKQIAFNETASKDFEDYTLFCTLKKGSKILDEFRLNYISGKLAVAEKRKFNWYLLVPIIPLIFVIILLYKRRKVKVSLLIFTLLLIFLPSLTTASCSPNKNYLCCPTKCPSDRTYELSGSFQVKDDNNDGLFEPGENLTVTFETVLPSCANSVDFLSLKIMLYDANGNLLKSKTSLYSTRGEGNNVIDYTTKIQVPLDIDTPKIEVKAIANATAIHGSISAREGKKEAFDSCVLEALKQNGLEELPLNQTVIDDLKNTKDSLYLPYTINTEEIYIDKNRFTLSSGSGHPYWIFSAYDLAKCLYNWDKCMRMANTECICCGNTGGYYGAESRGEWSRFYSTNQIKPYFKDISYTASEKYFNIFWSAAYEVPVNKKLAVNCFLNNRQGCDAEHFADSRGSCTIKNPEYEVEKSNTVKCTVYNPTYPRLNSTNMLEFKAIDFKAWLGAKFGQSFAVGQPSTIPIYVQNLGILQDSYKVTYEIISGSNFILLELPANYIENVKTNEIKFINAKIILLTSNKVTVKFCVNSDSHPDFCSYSNNMEQKCCQTIEINGKTVALSDITALEILQLILISIAILLIKFT